VRACAMTRIFSFFRSAWRSRDAWLVLMLLAVSLGLNVYLGFEVELRPHMTSPRLVVGMRAPKLFAEQVGGSSVAVDWKGARPTLLYVFSPSCVWCQRNFENFETVARARKADYRIVGLSTTREGLTKYVEDHGIQYVVYTNPDAGRSGDLIQSGTPTTFIISPEGTIKDVWRGAYTGRMKAEVEAALAVKLPGITSADATAAHAP
jgi:peroxiredoxin